MSKKKKVVGYVRVSTKGQVEKGYSIDAQKEAIRDWERKHSEYKVVKIFVDEGKSATNARRPKFKEMLAFSVENNVSACIVYHTDRFARNELVHSLYKKELLENGVELISTSQPMIDTSPEGYLLDGVLANLNAYYSRDLGRKAKRGMLKKWEEGWYPGWAPLGYKNTRDPDDKSKKIIMKDEDTAPLIAELFRLYSTGKFSIQQLIEIFDEKGLKPKKAKTLNHSSVHNVLTNEFYYGRMHWSGLTKMGNHEPIITKELYDACQYVAAKHRNFATRRRKHNFVLRGTIYCGHCGRRYTAEWHKIKNSKKRDKIAYYHCTRKGGCYSKFAEKEALEGKVANLFKSFEFTDKFIELIRTKVIEAVEHSRASAKSDKKTWQNQLNSLNIKREHLEDKFISDKISHATYKRQHNKVQSEIDSICRKLDDIENKAKIDMDLIEEILTMTKDVYKTYDEASDNIKEYYLRFYFERIEVKGEDITKIIPTPTFNALLQGHEVIKMKGGLPRLDSNQ